MNIVLPSKRRNEHSAADYASGDSEPGQKRMKYASKLS